MKKIAMGLVLAAVSATSLSAQQYGRPAYPDNWNGGPPLPPLNEAPIYTTQGRVIYVNPGEAYVAVGDVYTQSHIVVPAVSPSYYFAGQPVYLHPQTQRSRDRAYQYRFGHNAPRVMYP